MNIALTQFHVTIFLRQQTRFFSTRYGSKHRKMNGVITIANTFEVRALAESGSEFFNTLDSRKTKETDGKHSNILKNVSVQRYCCCTHLLWQATISDKNCQTGTPPPPPFPSYSVLIASFVAHFWSALPDMAFQARHNTETVGGRMRVTFKLAKSFLGTFF